MAFTQLHLLQSPLQAHLINGLHAFESSGKVIQTGPHDFAGESLDQANSLRDGIS